MQGSPFIEHTLPTVSLIAAMTEDRVIGQGNTLPWDLPEDLQIFKKLTVGNTVIMGRKTFDSIGKPLPERFNIVLSRELGQGPGVQICPNFSEGLISAAKHQKPIFIIGGAELYRKALPIASEMHISWIEQKVPGDVFFPDFDLSEWTVLQETNYPGFTYIHYRRKEPQT